MPQRDKLNPDFGRPEHPADELRQRVVVGLKSDGVPNVQIADILGITEKTLVKHYSPELEHSMSLCNAAVKGTLFQKAMDGDTAALIFWAKTQMGWREAKDSFDEPPPTIEGSFRDITPRELARKVAHVLAEAKYGPYNKEPGNDERID